MERRVRFLDPEQEEISRNRQTSRAQQQTDSSKEDQKTQNWSTRQFSGQMNWDYGYGDSEYACAVAAAALAICSLEEAEVGKRTKTVGDFESSRNKIKSKTVDIKTGPPIARKVTRRSSNVEAEAKKPPSSSITPKLKENRSKHSRKEAKADAWERAQIEMIRKRHENMKSSISAWENEKKTRAKRFFERKRNELEQRRSRNQQHYQYKVARIDQIAREAWAQAEEKRRTEESQVKEKAKKIRSGGAPVTCFCF